MMKPPVPPDHLPRRPGHRGIPPSDEPRSARDAAVRILIDLHRTHRTGQQAIDHSVEAGDLPEAQRALATELVMGVMRHRLTLARALDLFAVKGFKRIDRRLREVLLVAAYQLIWLDGVPAFAAVNEAVEHAKAICGPHAGKFVNAVLRTLIRGIEYRRLDRRQADPVRALPVDPRWCCQFRQAIFPDPDEQPVEYLARATSHPPWLVTRWAKRIGLKAARQVCFSGLVRPPVSLRPNRLRTDAAGLQARLRDEGFEDAGVSADGESVVLPSAGRLTHTSAFAEGLFQPQDRTAMQVVRQMRLEPGQHVIDLCAGLGTKSTQMAELMQNRGAVLACDPDTEKLVQLAANCRRLGLTIVRTAGPDEIASAASDLGRVDWILVDAPCGNSGVLARRPEARYRLTPESLDLMIRQQQNLLVLADRVAAECTRLAYSTCSIDPAENEEVVARFSGSRPHWCLSASRRTLPGCDWDSPADPAPADWHDGGYWAVWYRS